VSILVHLFYFVGSVHLDARPNYARNVI